MKKDWIFGAIGGFINGFFGMGGGTVTLYPLQKKMSDKKKANATCLFIILPLTLVSIVIYFFNGSIDWALSLKVCVGGIVGAVVGALLLNKVKYKYVLWVYTAITVVGGLTMIFKRG